MRRWSMIGAGHQARKDHRDAEADCEGMESHQGRNPRIDLLLVTIITLVALTIRGVYIAQQHSDPLFDRPTIDAEFWHAWSWAFAAGERFESGPYYRAPLYAWTLGVGCGTAATPSFDDSAGPHPPAWDRCRGGLSLLLETSVHLEAGDTIS